MSKRKIRNTALGIGALAVTLLVAANAHAVPVQDQSYSGPASVGYLVSDQYNHAQTFTVGLSGQLTSIDIGLSDHPSLAGILTVSLLDTTGGAPGTSVLASNTINSSAITAGLNYYSVDLSAYNVFVTAGDVLAFSLVGSAASFFSVPSDITSPTYSGGSEFFRNTNNGPSWAPTISPADLLFRTYVDPEAIPPGAVPLPATLPLFASGLGVMGLLGWRRKRKKAAAMAAA